MMKKLIALSGALVTLAGCALGPVHAQNTEATTNSSRSTEFAARRPAAQSQEVTVSLADQTALYPTLSQLCIANNPVGNSSLRLGMADLSPFEFTSVNLVCYVNVSDGKPQVTFGFNTERTIINGVDEFTIKEAVSNVYISTSPFQGKSEVVIVAQAAKQSTYVMDYVLNLNANGQPTNVKDDFSGVAIGVGVSGFYSKQNHHESSMTCLLGGKIGNCVGMSHGIRTIAIPIGQQDYSSITSYFGWVADKMPTNHDLDRNDGRVDFQKALAELTALSVAQYKTAAADVQGAISDARKAIASIH